MSEERGGAASPSSPAVEVVDLGPQDVDAIADLHVRAFPESELGRQGVESVRRNYRWQFDAPHDLTAIGVRDDGRLQGFLLGGTFRGATIGFVKREWRFLLVQGIRHPSTVLRSGGRARISSALRLLLRRRPPAPAPGTPAAPPVKRFGVLAIAVEPDAQGRGIGQALMAEAIVRARAGGYERMRLNVHPDNDRAVDFYERGGWERAPGPDGWTGSMERPLD